MANVDKRDAREIDAAVHPDRERDLTGPLQATYSEPFDPLGTGRTLEDVSGDLGWDEGGANEEYGLEPEIPGE